MTAITEIPQEFINEFGEIIYPDSDGNPMADNTKQFEWIATIKGNLDTVFQHQADVFVAGDLLWYPVEGSPHIRVAPDVMVAFGRPKGHRGSYRQWQEGNIVPQVVFEILSPGNTSIEMLRKWRFYNRYGVEEYYVYDPDNQEFFTWTRENDNLTERSIEPEWTSPLLGVRFQLQADTLRIFDSEGKAFLTFVELSQAREQALAEAETEREAKEEALAEVETEREAKEEALAEVETEKYAKEQALAEVETKEQALIEGYYSGVLIR